MSFLVLQGSPCNPALAPYFALLVKWSNATVNSIYRGDDAASILHRHGKHTQREIHEKFPNISNPPGRSTHEQRSDGVAYPGPVGRRLEWWQVGIDVNDGDVHNMMLHAARHGWHLFQPYHRGVEFHHLNFKTRPKSKGWDRVLIARERVRLPRR